MDVVTLKFIGKRLTSTYMSKGDNTNIYKGGVNINYIIESDDTKIYRERD